MNITVLEPVLKRTNFFYKCVNQEVKYIVVEVVYFNDTHILLKNGQVFSKQRLTKYSMEEMIKYSFRDKTKYVSLM